MDMTDPELDDLVAAVWERNRASVAARLGALQDGAEALQTDPDGSDLDPARTAAHKLAGSLGAFGFPWASEVAIGIERLLDAEAQRRQDNGEGAEAARVNGARLANLVARLREMLPVEG